MYDTRLTIGWVARMGEVAKDWGPLAGVAALQGAETREDLPIAYVPRIPEGRSYRELLERAVAWGRR